MQIDLNLNDIIRLLNSNNWKSNLTLNDKQKLLNMRDFIHANRGPLNNVNFHKYLDLIDTLILQLTAVQYQGGKRKSKSKKPKSKKSVKKH